jgi:hypothetical protein
VLRVRLCSTSTIVTSGHEIMFTLSANMYIRFSVSVWAGIVWDTAVGPCLLCDRLTAQRYHDFLETLLPGLLEDVPLAVRQILWFQHDGAPAHYGEDISKKVDWTSRPIAWIRLSPDLTLMDFSVGDSCRSTFMKYLPGLSKISWQDFKQQ